MIMYKKFDTLAEMNHYLNRNVNRERIISVEKRTKPDGQDYWEVIFYSYASFYG